MGKIIHWIDTPGISCSRVRHLFDSVDNRITHVDIWGGHVNLCPQNIGAIFKLAISHTLKQIEVLNNWTISVRTLFSRFCQSSSVCPHLLSCQAAYVCFSIFDKLNSKLIQRVKIIWGIVNLFTPLKSEPFYISNNWVDIFLILLGGVGIIKSEITFAFELLSHAKVEADRFCMSNVEKTIGFRWKTGDNLSAVFSMFKIFCNYIFDKVIFSAVLLFCYPIFFSLIALIAVILLSIIFFHKTPLTRFCDRVDKIFFINHLQYLLIKSERKN